MAVDTLPVKVSSNLHASVIDIGNQCSQLRSVLHSCNTPSAYECSTRADTRACQKDTLVVQNVRRFDARDLIVSPPKPLSQHTDSGRVIYNAVTAHIVVGLSIAVLLTKTSENYLLRPIVYTVIVGGPIKRNTERIFKQFVGGPHFGHSNRDCINFDAALLKTAIYNEKK